MHNGGAVRVLPDLPVAQRHAVDRRNLEADFPPVPRGVTGLLEASVGRWLRFFIEAVLGRGTATSRPIWRAICGMCAHSPGGR